MSNETGKEFLRVHLIRKFGQEASVDRMVEHMIDHGLIRSRDARAYLAREWYQEQWIDSPANGRTSAQVISQIAEKLDLANRSVWRQVTRVLQKRLSRN